MGTTRLIYLDHSSIITLERVLKLHRSRFDSFVHRWHEEGCVLALSMVHMMEISGSQHADSREARAAVLRYLSPARADTIPNPNSAAAIQHLAGREVLAAGMEVVFKRQELTEVERSRIAFPSTISRQDLPRVLRMLMSRSMRRIYEHFRAAVSLEARAFNVEGRVKKLRLRDFSDSPVSEEQAFDHRKQLAELFENPEWKEEVIAGLPDDPYTRPALEAWIRSVLEEMLGRGARDVFAEHVGAEVEASLKKFTHQLIAEHVFRGILTDTARGIHPVVGEEVLAELRSRIKLEHCPGTWLRFAVDQELRGARNKWEPGATYDLLHLAHLPYVDVLFADAEIARRTEEVLRRPSIPSSVAGCHAPVAAGNSVEAMEDVLFSRAELQ